MNGNFLNLTLPNPLQDWTFNGKFPPLTDNAFRLLGVTAGASQTEISQAFESSRKRLKLGIIKNKATDLEWLGKCRRTESSILEAYGRLSNPSLRLKERLFWFHQEIVVPEFSMPDDLAKEIKKILEKGGISARHSPALVSLAVAFSFDSNFNQPQIWQQTVHLWEAAAADDEFWAYLAKLDLQGDFEPAIYPVEIEEMRSRTMELVLEEIAGTIKKILARDQINRAVPALECIRRELGLESHIDYFENRTLGEYEEKYAEICDEEFEGDWLKPYSVRSRVLTYLKALLLLSGSQSNLTNRLLTVSASHFLDFVKHYPTDTQERMDNYNDFIRIAWILAPPNSYIFDEVAEYVQNQGLNLRIPQTDSNESHFQLVLDELGLTVATFSGQPPVVLKWSNSSTHHTYPEVAQEGDFMGNVQNLMWVVGLIIMMAFCFLGRFGQKGNTYSSKYPTYTPPNLNISFTPPQIILPDFSSFITTFELDELIRQKKVIVVDARTQKAFAKSHITGAVWFSAESLPKIVENQRKTRKKVVVYGQTYPDSMTSRAEDQLKANGVKEVILLFGGYQDWLSDRNLKR